MYAQQLFCYCLILYIQQQIAAGYTTSDLQYKPGQVVEHEIRNLPNKDEENNIPLLAKMKSKAEKTILLRWMKNTGMLCLCRRSMSVLQEKTDESPWRGRRKVRKSNCRKRCLAARKSSGATAWRGKRDFMTWENAMTGERNHMLVGKLPTSIQHLVGVLPATKGMDRGQVNNENTVRSYWEQRVKRRLVPFYHNMMMPGVNSNVKLPNYMVGNKEEIEEHFPFPFHDEK